jgi:RimJ/RimL family protein N-acetyltransferase
MFQPLTTPRLRIRRYVTADIPGYLALRADPLTRLYQSFDPNEDATAAAAYFARMDAREPGADTGWFNLAVEGPQGHLVGDVGFNRFGAVAEIGYTLGPDARGRGYATEAVGALIIWLRSAWAVPRVEAEIDARNAASRRVLERLGFTLTAASVEPGEPPVPVERWGLATNDLQANDP